MNVYAFVNSFIIFAIIYHVTLLVLSDVKYDNNCVNR